MSRPFFNPSEEPLISRNIHVTQDLKGFWDIWGQSKNYVTSAKCFYSDPKYLAPNGKRGKGHEYQFVVTPQGTIENFSAGE